MEVQDLRQTRGWSRYLQAIGWEVEKIPQYLYIKKLPLLPFSIAKLQRPQGEVNWEQVQKVCKKHKVVRLYRGETVCKKTVWIDLRKSKKRLLKEMKAKTRYNLGLAKRRGVKIKIIKGKEILKSGFYTLLRENAKRIKIFLMPKTWFETQVRAFRGNCFAILAYSSLGSKLKNPGGCLAGSFFMVSRDACFYSHNGSTEQGRKLMAPSLCVWEGMVEAKRRHLKVFDFDGIYDGSRSLKRWQGFTKFKQGFGGKVKTF